MNCCDYDCNQGRDCPARVAKVGRRITKTPQPLRHPSLISVYLRSLAKAMVLVIAVMLVSALTVALIR